MFCYYWRFILSKLKQTFTKVNLFLYINLYTLKQACHALVAPRKYYEACVYDACACDSGGDCECLCTAIHAYAQECNRFGVHVYWRSQQMCRKYFLTKVYISVYKIF